MATKSKPTQKAVSFDEYKTIKDEIIEISEQRFENILTKRLQSFKKEFKSELMTELVPRFDAIDIKFNAIDARFNAVDARFDAVDARFDAIDTKFDAINQKFGNIDAQFQSMGASANARFDAVEKRLTFITWILPFILTAVMALFKFI